MIISVLKEVSSIGYPQAGKNGIGKMIRIQIAPSKRSIFHLSLSLERNSIVFDFISIIKDKLFLVLFSSWIRITHIFCICKYVSICKRKIFCLMNNKISGIRKKERKKTAATNIQKIRKDIAYTHRPNRMSVLNFSLLYLLIYILWLVFVFGFKYYGVLLY